MQHASLTYDLVRSIKTTQVLGEVVDVQLREAAWAALARLRQQADAAAPLMSLRRWEHALCGNMAGLASVMSTRLAVRLAALMQAPQEMVSEAFVAALLLLRCHRAQYEPLVLAAWQNATSHELMDALAQALMHGGLQGADSNQRLMDGLNSDLLPLKRSAARIIGARRMAVHGAVSAVNTRSQTCHTTFLLVLDLMADGAWPLDARPIARALASGDPDAVHGAERVLQCYGLQSLARRARWQLQEGNDASLLGLEALTFVHDPRDTHRQSDLQLLAQAAKGGRQAPLVAHALGLTGSADGARLALQLLHHCTQEATQEAATQSFACITGIEPRADGAANASGHGPERAQELAVAWGAEAKVKSAAHGLQLYGRPASAEALVHALPHLHVGRWQSLRRLLLGRSAGGARLSPWALVQQQLAELEALDQHVLRAMGANAPGLQDNSLTRALGHMGAI